MVDLLSAPVPRKRYATLEAWRGFACISVVLFHSFAALSGQPMPALLAPVRAVAGFGWFGVDLFFVISGYCIAEKAASMSGLRGSARRFLTGRFLRILPPYWCALALSFAVGLLAMRFNGLSLSAVLPQSPRAWLAEIFLCQPYLNTRAELLVSWSLVYELGFYLLTASLLFAGKRFMFLSWFFALGAVVCAGALLLPATTLPRVLGLWPDFYLGTAAYAAVRPRSQGSFLPPVLAVGAIITIAVFAFGALALPGLMPDFGGWRRVATAGFALILVVLHPFDGQIAERRFVRGLTWVGTFSYSLYLIHVIVLTRVLNLGLRFIATDSITFLGLWLLAIVSAIAGGLLFFRWVEQPLERVRTALVETRPCSN
jgi:peptidoglycan/LPS O-acetylase OafA/YrhL